MIRIEFIFSRFKSIPLGASGEGFRKQTKEGKSLFALRGLVSCDANITIVLSYPCAFRYQISFLFSPPADNCALHCLWCWHVMQTTARLWSTLEVISLGYSLLNCQHIRCRYFKLKCCIDITSKHHLFLILLAYISNYGYVWPLSA